MPLHSTIHPNTHLCNAPSWSVCSLTVHQATPKCVLWVCSERRCHCWCCFSICSCPSCHHCSHFCLSCCSCSCSHSSLFHVPLDLLFYACPSFPASLVEYFHFSLSFLLLLPLLWTYFCFPLTNPMWKPLPLWIAGIIVFILRTGLQHHHLLKFNWTHTYISERWVFLFSGFFSQTHSFLLHD